ncbi:MAG: DNA-directed RNA polymerase subunit omega [Acidobacteria bacterium]|nr:MAG: DNA-directed RNA polymerase subunit omega [Acidobacteriota bacterium]
MPPTDKTTADGSNGIANKEQSPRPESQFRLIVVAALRAKQLLHGARPRIEADLGRRRNTSIAIEEVKRGLVPFTLTNEYREKNGDGREHE